MSDKEKKHKHQKEDKHTDKHSLDDELERLQQELVKLLEWVKIKKLKVVVLVEGTRCSRERWRN